MQTYLHVWEEYGTRKSQNCWKVCQSSETSGFYEQCFSNMSTVELAKCKPSSFGEAVIGPRLKICSAVAADEKFVSISGKFAPRS